MLGITNPAIAGKIQMLREENQRALVEVNKTLMNNL
jgi:hypothetical protein